eukprot:TRINITY_DN22944_c0_g1_i3.p1 TRINITY_DN22944_c0_g1~~TRINITY_DN22944_c0_g1_i3.p1  ORF type:complete len:552 (-),score=136.98 TRINITY_DN22944_c0_g1_i3:54-1709(-)
MTLRQWTAFIMACAVTEEWELLEASTERGKEPGYVNLYQVCDHFVKPWTRGTGNSVALLMNKDEPLVAKLMISHSWGACLYESMVAVLGKSTVAGVPLEAPVWFCTFAQYQPGDFEGDCGPTVHEQLALDPFRRVIETRPSYGMLVIHTSKAEIYNRLWCVYEVNEAREADVQPVAAVSMGYLMKCMQDLDGFDDLKVNTEEAICFSKEDAERITQKVLDGGGFEILNSKIWEFRCSSFARMEKTFQQFIQWGETVTEAVHPKSPRRHSDPALKLHHPWNGRRRSSEPDMSPRRQRKQGERQQAPSTDLLAKTFSFANDDDDFEDFGEWSMTPMDGRATRSTSLVEFMTKANWGDPTASVEFLVQAISRAAVFVGLHCLAALADDAEDEETCLQILDAARDTLYFFNSDDWELPEGVALPPCFDPAKFKEIPDTEDDETVIACLQDLSLFPQAVGLLEMGMGGSVIGDLSRLAGLSVEDEDSIAEVEKSFRNWNDDGSGRLKRPELAEVLLSMDPDLTQNDIEVMFRSADQDQDGSLTFEEFLDWLTRTFT